MHIMLSILTSIKATDQPEMLQKAECTFPGTLNCTDARWRCPVRHLDWQLDGLLTTLGLSQIWEFLKKNGAFYEKASKKVVRKLEYDDNDMVQ